MMHDFSKHIAFVDESGDHCLSSIHSGYPVFVLAFCIFEKSHYINIAIPALHHFKCKYFGHDQIILHEIDIRKSRGPFNILLNKKVRNEFMKDLSNLIQEVGMTVVACCINKTKLANHKRQNENPYHIAMGFGLERIFMHLQDLQQHKGITHVVFEKRGKKEDSELIEEFNHSTQNVQVRGLTDSLRIVMASKQSNAPGLQYADLIARPIGRHLLNPNQDNRAFEIIKDKFRTSSTGVINGYGLKIYP